jgi:glycolate dehydrogenase FAD-binding subunit
LPSVSSLAEAADFLATANAEGRRVRIGEDLTTDGLDRIVEHEPGDLTCVVEAGIRLSALQRALAEHGQRLALDPPGDPTIGACLAANLSGPLRHRFGAPRDLVLGVTLVLADGTIANAGGKVVKNVAGYDLGKLVCGSRGTLGLIARVSLRLHPVPKSSRTLGIEVGPEDAAQVATAVMRSQLEPSALDLEHPLLVVLLFEGSRSAVEAQMRTAQTLVGGTLHDGDIWEAIIYGQETARGRLRFAPGHLAEVLADLGPAIVRPGPGVAYVDHEVAEAVPESLRGLHERVRAAFDPKGILSAA